VPLAELVHLQMHGPNVCCAEAAGNIKAENHVETTMFNILGYAHTKAEPYLRK
jgi:hypothetical protein